MKDSVELFTFKGREEFDPFVVAIYEATKETHNWALQLYPYNSNLTATVSLWATEKDGTETVLITAQYDGSFYVDVYGRNPKDGPKVFRKDQIDEAVAWVVDEYTGPTIDPSSLEGSIEL